MVLCGISQSFDWLSPTPRQITHALLTRAPLCIATSFDLHVLGTPPAFVLSQNQTLQFKFCLIEQSFKFRVRVLNHCFWCTNLLSVQIQFTSYSDFKERFIFSRSRGLCPPILSVNPFFFFFFDFFASKKIKSCCYTSGIQLC